MYQKTRGLSYYSLMHTAILAFFLALANLTVISVNAQSGINPWSQPQEISHSLGFYSSPHILADKYGRLHVFWIENTALDRRQTNSEAICYTLSNGQQWAEANDIIAVNGSIRGFAVILDTTERFHLLLIDQNSGALLYSSADMWEARHPLSWSTPQRVVDERVSGATMVAYANRLFVAYTLWEDPFEVYFVSSDADDIFWSEPIQLSNISGNRYETALAPSLAYSPEGNLYLVWAQHVLPEGYPPQRIMFSHSVDGGVTWSEPIQLSAGPYGLPSILVAPDETLYVTYNGAAGTAGRYLLYSTDAGMHWSERITIAPRVGGLTGGTMALDCAGTLHYASASDEGSGGSAGINGVAYSQWSEGRWRPLHNIAGVAPGTDNQTRQGYEPAMVVAQCNQLHVIYLGANHGYVYHTATQTNAPSAQPAFLASPTPSPTPIPIVTTTPEASIATPIKPLGVGQGVSESTSASYLHPVIVGVLPALIFAIIILLISARGFRSRMS